MNLQSLLAIFAFFVSTAVSANNDVVFQITSANIRSIQAYFKANPNGTIMRVTASRDTADRYGMPIYQDLDSAISISFRSRSIAGYNEWWMGTTVISVDSARVESFIQSYDRGTGTPTSRVGKVWKPGIPFNLLVPMSTKDDTLLARGLSADYMQVIEQTIFRIFVMTKFLESNPFNTTLESQAFKAVCQMNMSPEERLGERCELGLNGREVCLTLEFWSPKQGWDILIFWFNYGDVTLKHRNFSGKITELSPKEITEKLEAVAVFYSP